MATGHRGLACLVFMCIAIAWRSLVFLGWSSFEQPCVRQNGIVVSRHQPLSRQGIMGIPSIAVEEESRVLELEPSQHFAPLGPSTLAGNLGTTAGSAVRDTFAVRLRATSQEAGQSGKMKEVPDAPEIIVYGRDSCVWCSTLSSEYDTHGIAYRKVDVADRLGRKEMWSKVRSAGLGRGRISLPVVEIAGTLRVRPSAADVKQILAIPKPACEEIDDLKPACEEIDDADESISGASSEDPIINMFGSVNGDEAKEMFQEVDGNTHERVDVDEDYVDEDVKWPFSNSIGDEVEELKFAPGQKVVVLAPPAMAGRQGTIHGSASGDMFAVQLESGRIFNIPTEVLRDANQPGVPGFLRKLLKNAKRASGLGTFRKVLSGWKQSLGRQARKWKQSLGTRARKFKQSSERQEEIVHEPSMLSPDKGKNKDMGEMEFAPGEKVVVLGPPAAAGKTASVLSRVPGGEYDVQFETGTVFRVVPSSLQPLSDGSALAAEGGAGDGDGSGKDRSGIGGGGEGVPPGNAGSDQADPESGDGALPLWLEVAILVTLMIMFSTRRGRRNHSRSRVDRQWFVHAGAPASIDPMLALIVFVATVSAVLLSKLALWTRREMPGILKSFASCFRAVLASKPEAVEQVKIEAAATSELQETVGSHLQSVGLIVVGFIVFLIGVVVIIATVRKHIARLGKDKRNKDLAVIQERRILRVIEPEAEQPPKPHEDSPEVHFRCIMLVAKCRLFLAGDCESTGSWDPGNSIVELKSDQQSHPFWIGTWYPRAESSAREFEFKLVLVRPDGQLLWEDVETRKLLVSPRERLIVDITFNDAGMQVSSRAGR